MKFLPAFYNVFDDLFYDPFMKSSSHDMMKTDIVEQGDRYLFNIALPGYKKEDIQMELKDGYLLIYANQDESREEKDDNGHIIRQERYRGSCSRHFYVGHVQKEDIKPSFANGELKISLPKTDMEQIEQKTYTPID